MTIAAFVFGLIFWTFLEYILHRFLGHVHKGKNLFKTEHTQHHAKAHYFAPAWKKAIVVAWVASALIFLTGWVFSFAFAIPFVLGLVSMYVLYETTHKRFHSRKPLLPIFIPLRKHHFYHHFHNPRVNHGVTTRFWDKVFGTYKEVEMVQVPYRMCMQWLIDGEDIASVYHDHFRLKH